jgi:hypothetical protein
MNAEAVMTIPILIDQVNGHFVATLLGAPELRIEATTRDAALSQMRAALQARMTVGELVFLDVPEEEGILAAAGTYKDDPFLADIRDEIYRQRDAEPKE